MKLENCKNVSTDGTILICRGCRRVLGYFDEQNIAHLYDVRLQRFEAPRVEVTANQRVQFVRVSEHLSDKRKYPVDSLDLADEPPIKRKCVEESIMRIDITNGVSTVEHDIGEKEKQEEAIEPELSMIEFAVSAFPFSPRASSTPVNHRLIDFNDENSFDVQMSPWSPPYSSYFDLSCEQLSYSPHVTTTSSEILAYTHNFKEHSNFGMCL